MAFWDGGARNLSVWKRLRLEIASLIREHALEEHWRQCFVSCGEYDPAEPCVKATAMPSALPGKVVVDRVPANVVDAVRFACGIAEK